MDYVEGKVKCDFVVCAYPSLVMAWMEDTVSWKVEQHEMEKGYAQVDK